MKNKTLFLKLIFLFCAYVGLSPLAHSQSDSGFTNPSNPMSNAQLYIDQTGLLSYQEIISPTYQTKFKPALDWGNVLNFGFSSYTYWLKLTLTNEHTETSKWILEIPYFGLDHIDFYTTQDNVIRTGNLMPIESRDQFYRYYAFQIELSESPKDFYFKINSKQNLSIPLRLWEQSAFDRHIQSDTLIQAFYYGGLGILAAFNFLIFLYIKDSTHLYYSAFSTLFGLGIFAGNGYGRLYIWPNSPQWDQISQVVLLTLAAGMALIFSTKFLLTQKEQPRINWIFNFLIIVLFLYAAVVCSANAVHISKNLLFEIFPILIIPVIVTIFFAGVRAYRAGQYSAKFFLISWGVLCIGGIFASLRQLDLIPTNGLTSYALQISSSFEMLLLSFAIASRIQDERSLREKAQHEALLSKETLLQTLRASEERLEKQVFQRTNDLSVMLENEKQLREQYIRFGSLISHEFRSPLGIIENQAALLIRQIDNDAYKKRLSIISSATHRLALLFDRWLQGDRLESRIDTVRPQIINVDSWLKDTIEKCRTYHPNHQFILDTSIQIPNLVLDEKMLEVVVLNIIDNACKYSDPHSTVRIRLLRDQNKIGVSITDSGIGIDPGHHNKIFNEYVQIHPADGKRGYGLGLSFVKKVMDFYGGQIQVNSHLGSGSEFIAWFPESSIAQPIDTLQNV